MSAFFDFIPEKATYSVESIGSKTVLHHHGQEERLSCSVVGEIGTSLASINQLGRLSISAELEHLARSPRAFAVRLLLPLRQKPSAAIARHNAKLDEDFCEPKTGSSSK